MQQSQEFNMKARRPRRHKKKKMDNEDSTKSSNKITPNIYSKSMCESVRTKLGQYVMSLYGNKKLDEENVMRVKGKALNTFLGIIKADMPVLAIEGIP